MHVIEELSTQLFGARLDVNDDDVDEDDRGRGEHGEKEEEVIEDVSSRRPNAFAWCM